MSTGEDTRAIVCEPLEYDSADGRTRIHALRWVNRGVPKGVVQLVHGMEEHIERYDGFARFLAAAGYAVCGNDHVGHGRSVASPERLSCLPLDGAQVMRADVHALRGIVQKSLGADTPYVVFGHSMGSFVVRTYLARHGRGLAGAVLCGTGQPPVAASRLGSMLAQRSAARRGADAKSPFISSLADGAYSRKIKDARTPFDWISTDPAQVDAYIADPLCGQMFSLGGYASLFDLTAESASAECAGAVPDGLPVLFIAGGQDPVGDNGKGVQAAAEAMRTYSKAQVSTIIYPEMRHEILNEPGRQRVYDDVLAWLDAAIASSASVGRQRAPEDQGGQGPGPQGQGASEGRAQT